MAKFFWPYFDNICLEMHTELDCCLYYTAHLAFVRTIIIGHQLTDTVAQMPIR